jgi:DNA-binding transcriptional LysR family regulator
MPKTLDDLSKHDCLINALKAPTNYWTFTGKTLLREKTIRVHGCMRSNFGESLRQAALLGHGISMHPTYKVDDDIAQGRLKVVLPSFSPTGLDVYAVYASRRKMPGRVRLFLDFLIERFTKGEGKHWSRNVV